MFELESPDLDRVLKQMREFAPKLQRKGLTQALRKGARPIVKQARANAPKDTGAMRKAIVARANTRLGRREGGRAVSIGFRGGSRQYVSDSRNRRLGRVGKTYEHGGNVFYWRFIEFGFRRTNGKHVAPRPFMQPALAENVDSTTMNIMMELRKAIDRIAETGR